MGKSTLAFALLAKLAAGEPFVGLETAPSGVLLLSEERRDTLAEKARILGLVSFPPPSTPKSRNETKRPVHVLMRQDAPAVPWPELVRQAMAYAHQHGLGVLVVDTWDRWTGSAASRRTQPVPSTKRSSPCTTQPPPGSQS